MAKLRLAFLLFLFLHLVNRTEPAISTNSKPTDFIVSSCKITRYPSVCVESLAAYGSAIKTSERQLATAALSVSLKRARSASTYVSKLARVRGIKPRDFRAVKDCIENMGDSVDRLSQSAAELGKVGRRVGQGFIWHMSNVQTWVSAALTDENTCMDGFADKRMDPNLKAAIRRRITVVAQVTSNALALVNRFSASHKP